mmetsp:Transcript_36465/g.102986  ORF Transcript_36465/g.102986 Transcript_36465/m.102986 type:complete len:407 (-) Transcript_36465:331-1551(-)
MAPLDETVGAARTRGAGRSPADAALQYGGAESKAHRTKYTRWRLCWCVLSALLVTLVAMAGRQTGEMAALSEMGSNQKGAGTRLHLGSASPRGDPAGHQLRLRRNWHSLNPQQKARPDEPLPSYTNLLQNATQHALTATGIRHPGKSSTDGAKEQQQQAQAQLPRAPSGCMHEQGGTPQQWARLRSIYDTTGMQMDWCKVAFILKDVIAKLADCGPDHDDGLLVFGCGKDIALWHAAVPLGCPALFLEDNADWAGQCRQDAIARSIPDVKILHVDYRSTYKEWERRTEDTAWLGAGIPPEVCARTWSVVLVDAPFGGGAGRMKSIYWASQVVKPGGTVYLDDITRPGWKLPPVEPVYGERYLGSAAEMVQGVSVNNLSNSPGKMARYIVGEGIADRRTACPAGHGK